MSSNVRVESLAQLCSWLAACAKTEAPDARLLAADLGALAEMLERERRGNCKAHAAWAFGKLAELGYKPLLVFGRLIEQAGETDYHAWLVLEEDGNDVLFETMAADTRSMMRPLEHVKASYLPRFSGDAQGRTYIYPDQLHAQLQ